MKTPFCLLLLGLVASSWAAPQDFPVGQPRQVDQLPEGRLRTQLQQLPAAERARALQWLGSFHFPAQDVHSLHVDVQGGICYACDFQRAAPGPVAASPTTEPVIAAAAVPVSPFPTNLVFHSWPGAPNVLYINFSGETVTNTEWNTVVGRSSIPALPFSTDSDYTTYSDAEQVAIKAIWQRMAEDFAPFNIDVTTERPATFNNRTAVALITRNADANGDPNPYSTAGGVAYVNVFNTTFYANYRPAWVYHNNLSNREDYIAEAASHEVGHNLGLSHDGKTNGTEYYNGHGSGDTSWGPIMGTGYNRNVSQWSKGEYYQANNTEDDLAIMAGKIVYRTDDHGNTPGTATALILSGTNIVSTTFANDPANTNTANKGVLERNTDVDVFSFVTGTGPVHLAVNPWIMGSNTRGGNLDLLLELYTDTGVLVLSNNPPSQTSALIQTNLAGGQYFLHVRNTGVGDPFSSTPSGYTAYASLGTYYISGSLTEASGFVIPPLASLSANDLTSAGITTQLFTVTYSDNVAINVATIGTGDVRVTGPNGYDQLASLLSVNDPNNGTPRTATYALGAPGGGVWLPADNGTHTVLMLSNQVADTEGAYVLPSQLGQFEVAVPVTVYAASLDANPGWTLEPDWQYGAPNYSGGGPSSGYTGTQIIGYNLSGNYPNGLATRYANTGPITTTGSSSLTLRFRRWLGLRSGDTASIQGSTNGTTWTTLWTSSAEIADGAWQLVQYALPSNLVGSASLQLRWGLASAGRGASPTAIGWNLDDIELLGSGNLDTAPPVSSLNVANIATEGSPSHSCTVTYTDATAVKLASLDSADLLVTGPNGYSNLAQFVGADLPMDGSPLTGSYSMAAPGGTWDAADNGTYTITLLAQAVEDTLNNATPQTALGGFTVAINPPGVLAVIPAEDFNSSGTQGGPFSPASALYTLTNSGGSALTWAASNTVNWISLSAAEGLLAAGAATNLSVSFNANANSLAASNYADSVLFLNLTSGNGNTSRLVQLTVHPPPQVQLTVTVNNPAWGSVTPTGGWYTVGSTVLVHATPAVYYQLDSWTGDLGGTNNPLSVLLETNRNLQAVFGEVLTTNYPTPHWWLAQHGYTNDFEAAVTNLGANTWALWKSYVAGLDPTNPNSRLVLQGETTSTGDGFVLRWNPVAGRLYSIWSSTNLADGFSLVPTANNLPDSISVYTNPVPPDATQQFYRLEVQKP